MPVIAFRRNKIVATVGPASSSKEMLLALMEAGADVFRLNFSHGQHDALTETVALIREISRNRKRAVAILGDLQGPKIRTGMMRGDVMTLTVAEYRARGRFGRLRGRTVHRCRFGKARVGCLSPG